MTVSLSRIPVPNDVIGGKYRVESQVGEGGMAIVFAATHEGLRQRVAIKVIHPQYAGSPELRERFFREARALALIKSPHVARIFDVGTLEGGAAYLVLEYLEGLDLHQLLNRDGALSPVAAAAYLAQACDGLAEAHTLGILHRDLKPSNLFLVAGAAGEPCVKLLDFGLAKLTEEGISGLTEREDVMGSPSYMAPEQIRGLAQADARSDVWSLGVTLYELLTNAFPFEGATPTKVAAAVLTEQPIPLLSRRRDVPVALSTAVMECLVKEPERRMASAKDLADRLRPFATSAALPSFAATRELLASVNEMPRSSQKRAFVKLSSDATMRIAPNEPTYGGMMALVPPSDPGSSPPKVGIDTEVEPKDVSDENIRTLVHTPSHPAPTVERREARPPIAPRVEPRQKPVDERTQEPTLLTLDAADIEAVAGMHRRRRLRAWIVLSAMLAVSAVVVLVVLRWK